MASSSKAGPRKRIPVPKVELPLSTGPTIVPVVDLVPKPATEAIALLPVHVPEPEYIAKGNKVKCLWCGARFKTRRKYIAHYNRRHSHG